MNYVSTVEVTDGGNIVLASSSQEYTAVNRTTKTPGLPRVRADLVKAEKLQEKVPLKYSW